MTSVVGADRVAALRALVFGAVAGWNADHPHPLSSHLEHASIAVSQAYTDAVSGPVFTIRVVCPLAGSAPLNVHGPDLAAVAEHAMLTLEQRIAAEARHRADKAYADSVELRYGVAV